ncbi:MAG: beta-galactosidase [Janthinobacterium lividum]
MLLKNCRQWLMAFACSAALFLPHCAAAQSFAISSAGFTLQHNETLPPIPLRGYGTVAADNALYAARSGSPVAVLSISCADAAHARLMLAKYASDLHCLGGVSDETLHSGKHAWKAYHAGGQGWIVAGRNGRKLAVVSSPSNAGLAGALASCPGVISPAFSQDTSAVIPMYLDKFDKYGFSFWYQPGSSPQGQGDTYDPFKQDLQYAKKMGVGLQNMLDPDYADSAENLANFASTGWVTDADRLLGVPTFIQFGGGTAGALWLANRWPEQIQQHAPGFTGDWYGNYGTYMGGPPAHISYSSGPAEDAENAIIARMVKHYSDYPTVTGYLEPHGEMGQSPVDLFLEYGAVADANYRRYLRQKYETVQAVNQRWFGGTLTLKSWEDVHLPEVAHFLGWGPQAVDLSGLWKIGYEDSLSADAKMQWTQPGYDDGKWPGAEEPGNDLVYFLPKKPALFRRSFSLSQNDLRRLNANGKVYLYVWDMNGPQDAILKAALNGQVMPDHKLPFARPDWTSYDVTSAVHEGQNLLALRLPQGFIGYKVYLSPDAPHNFPYLGPGRNAQWIDFRDFVAWSRISQMRGTMQAMRRADPDKFIKLMAPGMMEDLEKEAAADYGAYFHDTGGMSAFFFDDLPALLRSVGKPMSIEPSQGEQNADIMANVFGKNVTEGTNAIDYFPNLGDVTWNPGMKQWFEAHQPIIHLLGKYHMETAHVAVMHSIRTARLTDYPFTPGVRDADLLDWDVEDHLPYPRDDIVDSDFANGIADKYSFVIDANTTMMDASLLKHIEAWVRRGGTFMTYGETGRDSPDAPDSWPISALTGYSVKMPAVDAAGNPTNWGPITAVPGQTVLKDPIWSRGVNAAGPELTKVAPECQNILTWNNGSIAMGIRPLGKGCVISVAERTDQGSMLWSQFNNENTLFRDLLSWRGLLEPNPHADIPGRTVPFVSNNGLYDVTVVWGENVKQPSKMTLSFPGRKAPAALRDVVTGAALTGQRKGDETVYPGLTIQPGETRGYLAACRPITQAALEWISLQRSWWAGTMAPPPPPPAFQPSGHTIDLTQDWSLKPLGIKEDAKVALAANSRHWETIPLGIWNYPNHPDLTRGIVKKTFSIPAAWQGKGRIWWNFYDPNAVNFLPPFKAQVYLDGQPFWQSNSLYDMPAQDVTNKMPPGQHTLAIVDQVDKPPVGALVDSWIEFVPPPNITQDLSGQWTPSTDGLTYTAPISVPGPVTAAFLQRTFMTDPRGAKNDVFVYFESPGNLITVEGVLINRHFLAHNGPRGAQFQLNLTPWLHRDAPNSITIIHSNYPLKTVELRYYAPGAYP